MSTTNVSRLAIEGGSKAVAMSKPAWPVSGEWEMQEMDEVLRSGVWSWLGPHERAFCEEYADYIGTKYCVCMANGTVTLQCALQAVGVQPGDEVIVPGMTWVATAQAALDIGANVVFVDVDPESLCLSPKHFEAAVTPKTKAVIPVHLYGCMCDMDAIMEIAQRRGIRVVEDVAHQQGGMWRGKRAGSIGDAGSYSFQLSKILTSGEGGAVTCDDEGVYRTCFALKQVGWEPDSESPHAKGTAPKLVRANRYGHNYRITEMQCVLLRGGLTRLEEQNERREQAASQLAEGLASLGGPLRAAKRDPRVTRQAYYAMTLHFDASQAQGAAREQYAAALKAEGVPLGTPYAPVYRNPLLNLYDSTSPVPYRDPAAMQDYRALSLTACESAADESVLLLDHVHMLGGEAYCTQLLAAVRKVNDRLEAVRGLGNPAE